MAFPILRALHGAPRWVDPEVLGHQTAGWWVGGILWVGFTVVNYQANKYPNDETTPFISIHPFYFRSPYIEV